MLDNPYFVRSRYEVIRGIPQVCVIHQQPGIESQIATATIDLGMSLADHKIIREVFDEDTFFLMTGAFLSDILPL